MLAIYFFKDPTIPATNSTQSPARRRSLLRMALVLAVVLSVVAGVFGTGVVIARADAPVFLPGNIIDDAVFYNAGSMSEVDIQAFLDDKGSACSGANCLRAATFPTSARAADAMCQRYEGGSKETAARIISRVATACGINPQVLLVLLEKEQGLVTTTKPSETKYKIAMGYGCPDTAPCDSDYFGFFNQVYKSASQFIRYTNPEGTSKAFTRYAAGKTVAIRWSPDASCGASEVFIENKATASLYTYTPYQPNAAALAAGSGTGDACSAYGNRNFFNYFTSWFGSVRGGATQLIQRVPVSFATVPELAAAARSLGIPTTEPLVYTDGGIGQAFTSGWAYWDPASGVATSTTGAIGEAYNLTGGPIGVLGYPAGVSEASFQLFAHGAVYWSAETGAHLVFNDFHKALVDAGGAAGPIGFPTGNVVVSDGQRDQSFEHGWLHQSAIDGPVILVSGGIGDVYVREGGAQGTLGAPVAPAANISVGLTQQEFEHGIILQTAEHGAQYLLTAAADAYGEQGGIAGALGSPAGGTHTYANGTIGQKFSNGSLFISRRTGVHQVNGPIGDLYVSLGGPDSALGSPTGPAVTETDFTRQPFKNGAIVSTEHGAHVVLDRVLALYDKNPTLLGAPLASTVIYPSGKLGQQFERGFMYVSAADGAHIVAGAISTLYEQLGGPDGPLGAPTAAVRFEDGGGQSQAFKNGVVYSSRTGGTHLMTAEFALKHRRLGAGTSDLGHPVADPTTSAEGILTQQFQRGEMSWTAETGYVVRAEAAGPVSTPR